MRADLYIRVSTDEQAEKGFSQRDQEDKLRKYCAHHNITIRKVIYEDFSAKTFKRPEWQLLLTDLKKRGQVDLVLFVKWDRFSRNAGDAYQMINILRAFGVEPQAIEQPLDLDIPENKIMLAFYLAAPEVENDRRAMNTRNGMRRAVKEGRWMCAAPYGYANKITEDGQKYIAPVPDLTAVIQWSFETVARGQTFIFNIFQEARTKGLKCSKNTFWNMMRNPAYCGKILLPGFKNEPTKIYRGKHTPIISEALFNEVQDVLNGKKKKKATTAKSFDELVLRGFLICPRCGKLLTGSASKGRVNRYYYYHCHYLCGARFKSKDVNALFTKELRRYVPRPGMTEVYANVINTMYKKSTTSNREDVKKLTEKLEELTGLIQRARTKFMTDQIDKTEYYEFKKSVRRRLKKWMRS